MAQYRFIQNYTANVSVGGVVGIMPRTFNIGQVVNGIDVGGDNIRVSLGSSAIAIQGASNTILVPKSVLELFVPTQNNDLIDPPNVVAQNPNQLGMGIPSMVTGNATFSISSIDRTKFPLLSDQEISDAINSANNQVQNVGLQRAIEQFQSGAEYRLSQNNPRDTQLGLLINDLLKSKGINTMNRGNQQNNLMTMGMGMNNMSMGMGQGERARKRVFSQNIRENVKNALSSLRERVGKAKEEVERDFERTKAKIKETFDRRNKRRR
jgi:gas vesicle protein